jgi:hypothetical protein
VLKPPVTPAFLSRSIETLCEELSPGQTPQYVEVVADPCARVHECFPNVMTKVERDGGVVVIGWSIWESPGLFVEAEFHAVWRSPEGTLIDITPKATHDSSILFLLQPEAIYAGRQVNNVRRSISADPDVETYLRAHDAMFEFMNRGDRAGQHGEVSIAGQDVLEYEAIAGNILMLSARIANRSKRYDPYVPCWCGSGKKSKWCHKSPIPA